MMRTLCVKMGAVLLLTTAVGCTGPNPLAGIGNGAVGQQGEGPKKDKSPDTGPALQNCTYTQGYWKNHGGWPVSSLMLGNRSYSAAELQSIFDLSVNGNGLVSLAHQLIAAKLNLAQGADGSALGTAIADADQMIGSLVVPPVGTDSLPTSGTSWLVNKLTAFNQGDIGPGHCGNEPPPPPPPVCGDGMVNAPGEECDGGANCTADCKIIPPPPPPVCGDGMVNAPGEECDGGENCSADCKILPPPPPPPFCGDGMINEGEECDGGANCTADCKIIPPPPPCTCGNGVLDAGEECDDGNTQSGDGCSATCTLECLPPPPPPCGG